MAAMGRALFSPFFHTVLPHPCVLPDSRSHSKGFAGRFLIFICFLKFERSSSKRNYVGFLCELISSISANSLLTVADLYCSPCKQYCTRVFMSRQLGEHQCKKLWDNSAVLGLGGRLFEGSNNSEKAESENKHR
ncbi:uncharacterized protein LOC100839167 [Brachypodium distachyon]|uniref:uncharacterized protein LOC100839167 n=1 Tax=Brachypodium distachyon TaxID=15368 RepID=UPI00052FDC3C|nr:uncharacterized protein LOC100839167 [Brachypodium distachyon]|eukprot:XP_024311278.1 uncharacterized protein LOC100839167 [Brachypodium distachyon]